MEGGGVWIPSEKLYLHNIFIENRPGTLPPSPANIDIPRTLPPKNSGSAHVCFICNED